MNLNRIRSR